MIPFLLIDIFNSIYYTDHVSKLGFQTRMRPEFLSDMVGAEAVQLD